MKTIASRFSATILNILRILLYVSGFCVFFYFMGIENFQVYKLSRTSVVMVITYLMLTYFLTHIYGGCDFGLREGRSIFLSLELTMVLTYLGTYLMLIIMNTNDANGRAFRLSSFGFFLLAVAIQTLFTALLIRAGDSLYTALRPGERVLVITSGPGEEELLRRAIGVYGKRFTVEGVAGAGEEGLHQRIKAVDSVFFYDVSGGEKSELVSYCYKHLKNVYVSPDISDLVDMTARQMMFGDILFLRKTIGSMTFEQRLIKRAMDIVLSLLGIVLTSPVMLIAALAIKKEDAGKVFFRQKRATIHGRTFEIYKFRTMKENVENYSSTRDDGRITRVGKTLRRYRIDELPQLFNILKGEMSLVGPRPEMLENVDEYEKEMPEFKYRLRMKAGLTGLAQVMGRYNTTPKDKLILDLMYIENFSIIMDIRLLFQTLTVLFKAGDSTEGF
ncbi:MAG: sugar transferase [Lachnospiraceae bacterium]|nr:sugar transferase [Lachnospiraceae bacterium]